jgi:hypothetical protein
MSDALPIKSSLILFYVSWHCKSNDKLISWTGCGKKRSWHNLRYYTGLCLERLNKSPRISWRYPVFETIFEFRIQSSNANHHTTTLDQPNSIRRRVQMTKSWLCIHYGNVKCQRCKYLHVCIRSTVAQFPRISWLRPVACTTPAFCYVRRVQRGGCPARTELGS